MPLDLPPPLPPQQAPAAVLEERHSAARDRDNVIVLEAGQSQVLVSGNTFLSEEQIREATADAETPSQAVLLLHDLYTSEEYVFVNVQYARQDAGDMYVHVNEGHLAEVDAPPALASFFEPLEGESRVIESNVEPMRILAELKAERAGQTVSTRYAVAADDPSRYTLVLDARENPDHDRLRFSVEFGNPGNRFLGQYFGTAGATIFTPWGDQLDLSHTTAFTGIGRSRGGRDYDSSELRYQTVFPIGTFGIRGAFTEYEVQKPLADRISRQEAQINEIDLFAQQFIYANANTRWLLEERIEYVDSILDLMSPRQIPNAAGDRTIRKGDRLVDEQYGALRLGTSFSRSWHWLGRRGSLELDGGYKRGVTGIIQEGFVDPRRTAEFDVVEGDVAARYRLPANMVASIRLRGQFSVGDRLPQQQQWVLGGPGDLSAYLPGVLVGDSGAYGRLQLRLPRWEVWARPYYLALFVESGFSTYEDDIPPENRRGAISDFGLKLEYAPLDNVTVTAWLADGLSSDNVADERLEDHESNLFFSIRATF